MCIPSSTAQVDLADLADLVDLVDMVSFLEQPPPADCTDPARVLAKDLETRSSYETYVPHSLYKLFCHEM